MREGRKAHNSTNWNFSISVQKLRPFLFLFFIFWIFWQRFSLLFSFFLFSKKLFLLLFIDFQFEGNNKNIKTRFCLIYLKFAFIYIYFNPYLRKNIYLVRPPPLKMSSSVPGYAQVIKPSITKKILVTWKLSPSYYLVTYNRIDRSLDRSWSIHRINRSPDRSWLINRINRPPNWSCSINRIDRSSDRSW